METNYKIAIPKPCHEDWNQMTPDQTGRFCTSCVKSVVDFTNMKASEIQDYFIKNQGKSVCGRFKNEQLDTIIIQIPKDVLFSQVQFHKMFMLALLISMPGILNCQNRNGNSQKIDKVEVIDSISEKSDIGRVKSDSMTHQNVEMTPERKARIEELRKKREALIKQREEMRHKDRSSFIAGKVAPVVTGDVAVSQTDTLSCTQKDLIYNSARVQVQPTFPGGLSKFYDYFKSNFKVPEESKNITTKLIFSFVIDTDGSLGHIKLLRGINSATDKEAMRVLKASPKWIPGEQNGQKVKVLYSLPIKITAQ